MSRTKTKSLEVPHPTKDEVEDRIEYIMELEAQALLPGQIKRAFREKFGDVHHITINEYRLRARARLSESIRAKREELVERAVSRYEGIFRDPASDNNARIRAQERIDKIWGIEAPTRAEHSGVDGGPIQIEQLIAASELTAIDVERALLQVVNVPDSEDV